MNTGVPGTADESPGLPRPDQKLFAPYKIAMLIDTVIGYGISPETVLANTGLTHDNVRDPHTLTSIGDYITGCENILAAGASVTVAYEVGSRMHLSAYGMYGYALMCSPDMRAFLDFAVRYQLLATPILRLGWRQANGLAVWEFAEVHGGTMGREVRQFLVRQQMQMALTHLHDVAGVDIRPVRALFALPDPGTAEVDERQLHCQCSYDCERHELHFPASFLDEAPQFANQLTHAWLEETCEELLGQARAHSNLAGKIYQLMMATPGRRATMEAVAQQLGMSERTLRRRLADEGIRFADLADDVSKRLTLQFAGTTRMSADDIAHAVGFTDTANLRRAVKRWTGRPLGELMRK